MRQQRLEDCKETMERTTCQIDEELEELKTATEQAARDFVWANSWQGSFQSVMEKIGKLTLRRIAGEREALRTATEQACTSVAFSIGGELHELQFAWGQAGEDFALADARLVRLQEAESDAMRSGELQRALQQVAFVEGPRVGLPNKNKHKSETESPGGRVAGVRP